MSVKHQDWALFDADDTLIGLEVDGKLVGTSIAYHHCITLLCNAMAELGFETAKVKETQERIDRKRCGQEGFSRMRRFPISFRDTYIVLTKLSRKKPNPQTASYMESLGWMVFKFRAFPLQGAIDVLKMASRYYNLAIVTKGNHCHQVEKVQMAGCAGYARKIIPMRTKSTEEWERRVISPLKISEKRRGKSWVVGDSIKSDVNPALELGLSAIHVPAQNWSYENAGYASARDGSEIRIVNTIEEVLAVFGQNYL